MMESATIATESGHAIRCSLAKSLWHRSRGLLARRRLPPRSGLLIERCSSIHTIGMTYPIDVVFLDASWRVLRVVPRVGLCRAAWCRRAKHTLEMAAGEAVRCGIVVGTRLWRIEQAPVQRTVAGGH